MLRVIARLNMGGPTLHVSYLSAGLRERGYETILVAGTVGQGEQSMAYVTEELGVPVVTIPHLHRDISPIRDLLAIMRLARIIRVERPTILHTHTAKAGAVGRAAALLAGRSRPPIIVHTFHGHVLRGYFGRSWAGFFRQLERLLARVTDALVAVSPEVRDELVALGVAPASKFRVIRLGIQLDTRISPDGAARAETRRVMGIPDRRFVVGWIGRMTGVKRTDLVLRGFRALRDEGVDAVLCMVGDGPDRGRRRGPRPRARDRPVLPVHRLPGGRRPVLRRIRRVRPPFGKRGDAGDGDRGAGERLSGGGDPRRRRPGRGRRRRGRVPRRAGGGRRAGGEARRARPRPGAPARMGAAGRERMQTRYAVDRLVDDVDRLYRELLERKGIDMS